MERYRKRTIALCLASLLTVVGSFCAENYNNTLMELKVNVGSGGFVSLTAFTEKPYSTPIKTSKIDENTYVLTLKDTNNSASAPEIKNYENIESIQISTYPYTTESDGCTRIVVKTKGGPALSASQALFITDNNQFSSKEQYENYDSDETEEDTETEEETFDTEAESDIQENNQDEIAASSENAQQTHTPPDYSSGSSAVGTPEYLTILLYGSILLLLIGFIFMFSKNKMASVVGKQDKFDDGNKKNKQSKTKKLQSTINKLDKTYPGKKTYADLSYQQTEEDESISQENTNDEQDEIQNVVDLDILFQESQKPTTETPAEPEENSDDLADLLSSFLTEIPVEENLEEEQESFDEELYNKIINSKNLKFSDEDVDKINSLMQLELSSETIENIKKYISRPVQKPRTKEQSLADLISTYSIKQNITFSHEDIAAIEKLMSVELGPDFTKDFTTNPARTKIVEQEIKERTGKNPHRTSKIITLSVKGMLPDLSKELEKQKGKSIKYEAKANTVYFSEGYEYKKLQVPNSLSVISADQSENKYKPSYEAPIAETGYEVPTLTIQGDLPDLADAKANPDKYVHKKEKQTVDENALLNSIANVTFKPFYEETDDKINPFDDFESDDSAKNEIKEEPVVFDTNTENVNTEIINPVSENQTKKETRNDENAKKLLEMIEAQKTERELKKQAAEDSASFKKELEAAVEKNKKQAEIESKTPKLCSYNGTDAELIKAVKCSENSECRIIHANNKYIVLGNINNKEIILKEYTNLKNSNMYVRLNDKSDKTKYLVKVGLNKFLIQITNDNMEFVMDLC